MQPAELNDRLRAGLSRCVEAPARRAGEMTLGPVIGKKSYRFHLRAIHSLPRV